MDGKRDTRFVEKAKRLLARVRRLYRFARGAGFKEDEAYRAAWNSAAEGDALTAILSPPDGSPTAEREFDEAGRRDTEWLRQFITPESSVLDIGCGVGRIEKHLAPFCARLCAVDVSDEMIRRARRRTAGIANVEFYRANSTDFSIFPTATFDLVFSFFVLQHLDHEDAFLTLREISRVLKPKARAVLQFPNLASPVYADALVRQAGERTRQATRVRPYTLDLVARTLALAGLEVERIETNVGGTLTEHEIVAIVHRQLDPPIVSDFHIRPLTPEQAGTTVRWRITANVADLNRDIVGGHVEIRVSATGQTFRLPVLGRDFENDAIAAQFVLVDPPAGRIDMVFSVLDAVGVRSNEIPFFLTLAPEAGPAAGPPWIVGELRSER